MSYYQLPDDLNYDAPKIQLNVPSDEKGKDLAKHLPYLAQINDPIFQNRVEDLINSDEDLQSYLFATEDLNRSLEDSLQLLVSHGKINDATKVRHEFERNNADINFFQKNDNPLDVLFKEKAKFDVQNPIIGSLLEEINKGKITEKGRIEAVKGAPNPKNLEVEDRFNKLFGRKKTGPNDNIITKGDDDDNDDDDDDDDDDGLNYPKIPDFLPPISPIARRAPSPQLPERRPKPGDPDDEWRDERTRQEYFFPFSEEHGDPWRLPRRQINLDKI